MEQKKTILLMVWALLTLFPGLVIAGDFDWIKDFNIRAEADPTGFRAQLAARFKIGDAEVNTVIGNVEKPADAYLVCRLAEMANKPIDLVMNEYKRNKTKGWGVMAKNLGIKPGSKEFHALKRGDDLYGEKDLKKAKGKSKK